MAEDILAALRAKEEELEAFVAGARREAAAIREAGRSSAREMKARGLAELDSELKAAAAVRMTAMEAEAAAIEARGLEEASRLKEIGEKNFERAVDELVKFIKEPARGRL